MKTKAKIFFCMCVIFTLSIKAQILSGGIVGGVSTSSVKLENVDKRFTDVLQGNGIHGFEAGVFAKLMISPFYVKPMALYNFSTGEIRRPGGANPAQENNFKMSRMEVPVLFGLNILGPLSIEGGPVYNYVVQSSGQFDDNNNISINKGTGMGYRIGLAAEVSRLMLNASYGGVTIKTNGLNGGTFKEPYKIVFGLGIKLGKIKQKS